MKRVSFSEYVLIIFLCIHVVFIHMRVLRCVFVDIVTDPANFWNNYFARGAIKVRILGCSLNLRWIQYIVVYRLHSCRRMALM